MCSTMIVVLYTCIYVSGIIIVTLYVPLDVIAQFVFVLLALLVKLQSLSD